MKHIISPLIPFKISSTFYIILCFLLIGHNTFAQQTNQDKTKVSRQRVIDSTKNALKQRTDSLAAIRKYKDSKQYKDSIIKARNSSVNALRESRKRFTDSVTQARKTTLDSSINVRKRNTELLKQRQKARTDSLTKIRKYKESKKFQDSVAKSRTARLDSMRKSRSHYFDSLKTIRQKTLDSAIGSRKKITDSLRAKQKVRTDSLTKIRKYKESKRYRDSVMVTRQSRLDSIRNVRKMYSDNIISTRKKTLDSLTKVRKQKLDSLTKVRKIKSDSLQNARDLRADSLAKKKELKEKQQKAEQKKKEEKMKMQFELKIKKKHEAWSNEKMLKKKWTVIRQGFQNTFTRYNYYYNARRKMLEANGNMQRRKKDNFEQLIDLFPFDPNKDSTVFASDMDTIIRKASVGLQIHDPRTKWADDLYLLMGEAYYFKGDYERADASFKYIIGMNKALKLKKKKNSDNGDQLIKKEKSKLSRLLQHQPAHNDAILWLTRTYADSKKEAEAEAILDLIDASTKLSDNMKAKIALEKANLHVRKGELSEAGKQLSSILKSKAISKYTRQRASFLNGQLYYQLGQYDSAANSFKKNLALHPPIEMDFYAHKYRADAVAQGGGDQSKSIASLKRLLRDGKYAPYHEQVYYLLGKLSANDNKLEDAIAYYTKSLQQSKTTPKQKAITFAAMGNLQYKAGQYNLAKKSYDSASYFAKGIKDNAELDLAIRRGKSLDKIEEPFYTLRDQDSLLRLSAMSEKEQRAVVRRYLKNLEKQKEDSIANADAAAKSGSLAGGTGTSGGTNNWYFSSTVAVQQGYNEFKRKWGNRPLADNWRRSSASTFGADAVIGIDNSGDEDEGDAINETSLMASIPKTELQLNSANKKLKRAYINLGQAYIKDLEEYKEGLATLDSLDKRFPAHEYPDEVLSLRYTAALRQGKLEEAEAIRQKLLSSYPNSNFSLALRNDVAEDSTNTKNSGSENVASYYETTYQLTNDRKYDEVIQRVAVAKRIYGDVTYSRKFRILEAQSYAAKGNYNKADTLLSAYIKEYPSDSLRPWVDAINKYIIELRAADTLNKDSLGKTAAVIAKDSTKADSTLAGKTIPAQYIYAPKDPHYCIFIFGKPDAKTAGFKSGLLDYSKMKFSGITLTTEIEMLNADQSIVIAKPFGSAAQAKIFMNSAKNEKLLFREMEAGSYQYFIISEQNYLRLKSDRKLSEYQNFYQKNYK